MLTDPVYLLASFLVALLLLRTAREKYFTKHLCFFSYLTYILVVNLLAIYVYSFRPKGYSDFYWYTQFLGVAVGYCVMWEIYTHVLRDFPGTAKMARCLVSGFFFVVLGAALFNAFYGQSSGLAMSVIRFERNLQAVQAVLLTLLLILVRYYTIPLGRNLRGLIWGYGIIIVAGIMTLTLRSYIGAPFQLWWQYLQPGSGLVASAIWLRAFWVYAPNPKADASIRLEEDYEVLAERTYRAIAKARASLLRGLLS